MLLTTRNEGSRTSRLSCRKTWRMRLYHGLMASAGRLFTEGRNIAQIAPTLDAQRNRVRNGVNLAPPSQQVEEAQSAGDHTEVQHQHPQSGAASCYFGLGSLLRTPAISGYLTSNSLG
jgi:hypothetical protein